MPKASPPTEVRLDSGNCDLQMEPATANEHSTVTRQPLIAKLSDDVLFLIFLINSRIEMLPFNKEKDTVSFWGGEQGTLTTNRYSSQVCRQWRNIILSSPAIWTNSLDIDELNQPGNEWRTEIMLRAGSLPISIMGRIGYKDWSEGYYAIDFVLEILEYEWDRIRFLSLCANNFDIKEQMLYCLQRPAPILEYLHYRTRLTDGQEPESLRREDGEVLFSNISPKLTFICCEGLTFDFVPGLSNLRQLWLTGHAESWSIIDFYRALQHLPLLEELFINDRKGLDYDPVDELGDHISSISLPRLAEITIAFIHTRFITRLVRHIVPAPGCRLVVSRAATDRLPAEDALYLSQFYSTYIQTITDFRPVQHISLSYDEIGPFWFRAAKGPRSFREFQSPSRCAHLTFGFSNNYSQEAEVMHGISIAIMKALLSRPIGHITQLELKLNSFAHSCPEVVEFLGKLESVSELTADFPTLRLLMDMQATSDSPLLPSTTTINVTPTSLMRTIVGSPKDYLDPFLKGRMDRGIPVRIIKLSKHDYSDDRRWDFLDEIEGLSVVWRGGHFGSEDDEEDSE